MPELLLCVERVCIKDYEDCPIKGQSAMVPIRPNPGESGESLEKRAIEKALENIKIWCKPDPCTKCKFGAAGDGIRKGVRFHPALHRGILLSSE